MKPFLTAVVLALSTNALGAPTLIWDKVPGATGYKVYCTPTPVTTRPTPVDNGAALTADLAACVQEDTQMEVWVTAYNATTESGDSDHLQFTYGGPPQTIVLPTVPKSLTITW